MAPFFVYSSFLDICKNNGYKHAFDMCKELKECKEIYHDRLRKVIIIKKQK